MSPAHLGVAGRHAASAGSGRLGEGRRRAPACAGTAHDALGNCRGDGGCLQAGGLIESLLPPLRLHMQGVPLWLRLGLCRQQKPADILSMCRGLHHRWAPLAYQLWDIAAIMASVCRLGW